jgi:hypothetical protein
MLHVPDSGCVRASCKPLALRGVVRMNPSISVRFVFQARGDTIRLQPAAPSVGLTSEYEVLDRSNLVKKPFVAHHNMTVG